MNKDCYTCKLIAEKDEEIAALNELGQEVATDCAIKDKELSKLRRELEEKEKQIIELETSYRIEYCDDLDGECVRLGKIRRQLAEKDRVIAALRAQQEQSAPAVRCKDCKFASEDGGYEYLEQINTHVNCTKWLTRNHARSIMPKDGFCSEGKRRSDCG